jgi:hypothetical protein
MKHVIPYKAVEHDALMVSCVFGRWLLDTEANGRTIEYVRDVAWPQDEVRLVVDLEEPFYGKKLRLGKNMYHWI